MSLDLLIFNFVNGFAGKWVWLDYFGIFFAKYFEYILLFSILLYAGKKIFFEKHFPSFILLAFVSAVISRFIFAEIIRAIWFRQRPFVSLNFIPLIQKSAAEASFPSGHASFYFALSTIIYLYNKKAGIIFYTASFLIAISRVFIGIHWPSDILSGAILGIATAWISHKIFNKYFIKYAKNWA